MFKFLVFLILANIFIANCVNFCEIENKFCGVEKHVACDINVIITTFKFFSRVQNSD